MNNTNRISSRENIEPTKGLDGVGYKEAERAFDGAINDDRLSLDEEALNYVGHYMYMGVQVGTGKKLFKHRITRQYVK